MSNLSLRPQALRTSAARLRDHAGSVTAPTGTPTVSLPARSADVAGAIGRLFASEAATSAWAAGEATQFATVLTGVVGDTLAADRHV